MKYSLGKKSTLQAHLESRSSQSNSVKEKWDQNKLKLGDWFSEMAYYRLEDPEINDINGQYNCALINQESEDQMEIPKNQVEEMFTGALFDSEEKISRTNMVELMTNAKECVFTVTFRKKVDLADVQESLKNVKK